MQTAYLPLSTLSFPADRDAVYVVDRTGVAQVVGSQHRHVVVHEDRLLRCGRFHFPRWANLLSRLPLFPFRESCDLLGVLITTMQDGSFERWKDTFSVRPPLRCTRGPDMLKAIIYFYDPLSRRLSARIRVEARLCGSMRVTSHVTSSEDLSQPCSVFSDQAINHVHIPPDVFILYNMRFSITTCMYEHYIDLIS